jgi:2-hydroxy-6-oxonona-2,4-dienedioate hydrolase
LIRYDTKINGHLVRYYEGGTRKPLLLIHGAGATAKLWHRQMGPFAIHFRVIAPDLPGFGGSARCPKIRSVRDYARFLVQFLSTVNVPRASVVGSSMGGWAALWLAADFPRLIDKLVLVSPAGVHRAMEPSMPVDGVLRELENYYKSISGDVTGVKPSEEMAKAIKTIKEIDEARGFVPDIERKLPEIKAPTLIIWGKGDRVVPSSYAEIFARAIPDARVRLMEAAGHLPYIEKAEEFNKIATNFLR